MPQPTTTAPAVFDALKWLAERQEVERSEGRTDRVKIRCPMPSHEDRETVVFVVQDSQRLGVALLGMRGARERGSHRESGCRYPTIGGCHRDRTVQQDGKHRTGSRLNDQGSASVPVILRSCRCNVTVQALPTARVDSSPQHRVPMM